MNYHHVLQWRQLSCEEAPSIYHLSTFHVFRFPYDRQQLRNFRAVHFRPMYDQLVPSLVIYDLNSRSTVGQHVSLGSCLENTETLQ